MKKLLLLLITLYLTFSTSFAQCPPAMGWSTLDVNNVRARMNVSGSNWWDEIGNAAYEVPAESGVNALFAGAFWIGGQDPVGQAHVAAVRFRQVGDDFWPGPLDQNGAIDSTTCVENDRIYKLNRWQVAEFRQHFASVGYVIPTDILEWPATGNPYAVTDAKAPFVDVNFDGIYDPFDGDYPAFAFDVPTNRDYHLMGDQCLWWVINDKGNVHTETEAESLGVEIQCMAYAFATCDPLNDQTFYRYTVTNKSTIDYYDTYIGLWVDVDLGFAQDDYVQCEVTRNLGFAYNGFAVDGTGGPHEYGAHPPAAGIGILEGPFANPNDGVDNDRDGMMDEIGERLMMSRFIYHNNSSGIQGDPATGEDYYNYMRGIWRDGAQMCFGQNGHPNGGCDVGVPALFMFPGDSDPMGYGTGGVPQPLWTEQTAGNPPLDRRFLMSSGPFAFQSGRTEHIHYGAFWARDTNDINDPFSSADALFLAKDYCQAKFDASFNQLDCCPPVAIIGLSQPSVNQFFFSSPEEGLSYFWDFGNGLTSDQRFPPSQFYVDNEVHTVTLIVSNACGSDTAYIQAGTVFFGVEEQLQEGIELYPNPNNGSFSIQISDKSIKFKTLQIYNAIGALVLVHNEHLEERTIQLNAPAGLYVAEMMTNKGPLLKRFVVY